MSIKLKDVRKTEKVSLPSYEGSEVLIYDGFRAIDQEKVLAAESDFEKGLVALQCLVKSWNFTDDDEKELPITKESLSQLSSKDFNFLLTKVSEVVTNVEVKKNVSSKT